jgi:hypothetical protein
MMIFIYNATNPEANLFLSGKLNFHLSLGYELNTTGEINAEMYTAIFSGIIIFTMLFNAYKMFKAMRTLPLSMNRTQKD